jgi:DNA invertase Pin-like site-specific DNA recombinase
MELDGYIRVSQVGRREGESFISPELQREQIEKWAALRGVTIANWETDLDRTGTVLSRPGMDRIMERIRGGQTGGVVVAKINRLSRAGVADALKLVAEIIEAGGTLAAIDLGIDPTTVFGEFALTLMLGLARMESRQRGEEWFAARKAAVDRGVFVGGFVPVGYLKGDDGRLAADPAVPKATIEGMFSRRAARESWSRTASWLSGELGRDISIASLRNLIANRTYLGEVHGGQGLVNRTAHPPLISRALFEAANAVKGVVPARSGNATGLLSGLIRCAGCRYAMKASMNRSRHGKPFLEYRCKANRGEGSGRCDSPASISAKPIDELVLGRFFERLGEYRMWEIDGSRDVEEAESRLLKAEAELDAALDTRLAEALGEGSDRYLQLVRTRQEAVDAARGALANAQSTQIAFPEADLFDMWPDLSLHDRRRLLASALDCVFVRRGNDLVARTHFCWRGEAPELPQSGRRWTPKPFDFPS